MQNHKPKLNLSIYHAYVRRKWCEKGFHQVTYRDPSVSVDGYEVVSTMAMAFILFVGGSGASKMISHSHPHIPTVNIEMLQLGIDKFKTISEIGSVYVPNQIRNIFHEAVPFYHCTSNILKYQELEASKKILPEENPFITTFINPVPQLRPNWEEVYIVTGDSLDRINQTGVVGSGYIAKSQHEAEQVYDMILKNNDYTLFNKKLNVEPINEIKYNLFMEKKRRQREKSEVNSKIATDIKDKIRHLETNIASNNSFYIDKAIHEFINSMLMKIGSNIPNRVKLQIKLDILTRISHLTVNADLRERKIVVMTGEEEWRYNQNKFNQYMLEKIPQLKPNNLIDYVNSIRESEGYHVTHHKFK